MWEHTADPKQRLSSTRPRPRPPAPASATHAPAGRPPARPAPGRPLTLQPDDAGAVEVDEGGQGAAVGPVLQQVLHQRDAGQLLQQRRLLPVASLRCEEAPSARAAANAVSGRGDPAAGRPQARSGHADPGRRHLAKRFPHGPRQPGPRALPRRAHSSLPDGDPQGPGSAAAGTAGLCKPGRQRARGPLRAPSDRKPRWREGGDIASTLPGPDAEATQASAATPAADPRGRGRVTQSQGGRAAGGQRPRSLPSARGLRGPSAFSGLTPHWILEISPSSEARAAGLRPVPAGTLGTPLSLYHSVPYNSCREGNDSSKSMT